MARRLTTKEFIRRASELHNGKYDYGKTQYLNGNSKVEIVCPEHGSFWQRASGHLNGAGCPKCGRQSSSKKQMGTKENFVLKAQKKHSLKYDYTLVNYQGAHVEVEIICPEHGSFLQIPNRHLNGAGCPECGKKKYIEKRRLTLEEFQRKAVSIHGAIFNYEKVNYINHSSEIEIICPEHGSFFQSANNHLAGHGCPKCAAKNRADKLRLPFKNFYDEAIKIHSGKYSYNSKTYVNRATKMEMICPEHGSFWQTPNDHLHNHGCPSCSANGFKKQDPAILYYFRDNDTGLYKIGITNRSVEQRFRVGLFRDRCTLLYEICFLKGEAALKLEQDLLNIFKDKRCINLKWPKKLGGRTEFFTDDILKKDNDG
jgi:predicted  nucleic acid-binding Zn-ribbon protein